MPVPLLSARVCLSDSSDQRIRALEPFVKERTELKKQWAQWRERDWLLTQEKVDIEVGFR